MKSRVYINSALKIVLSWLAYQGFQNLYLYNHIFANIQLEENLENKLNDKRYET